MLVNPVAENVCGTLGTILWCIQLIPQAWKSFREKSTFGLSPILMFMWGSASLPLGVYTISQNTNIPLIVQPQLFGTLAALCWVQCLYYDKRYSRTRTVAIFFTFLALLGGLQAGFVYAVRPALLRGNQRPLQFFGVMAAILIFSGLFPQFYEIWKLKEVRGVSMLFMLIDLLGGLFSMLSLVFKPEFDPLLAFSYIGVVVLDGLVIILHFTLNPRAKRRRAALLADPERQADKGPEEASRGRIELLRKEGAPTELSPNLEGDLLPPRAVDAIDPPT